MQSPPDRFRHFGPICGSCTHQQPSSSTAGATSISCRSTRGNHRDQLTGVLESNVSCSAIRPMRQTGQTENGSARLLQAMLAIHLPRSRNLCRAIGPGVPNAAMRVDFSHFEMPVRARSCKKLSFQSRGAGRKRPHCDSWSTRHSWAVPHERAVVRQAMQRGATWSRL